VRPRQSGSRHKKKKEWDSAKFDPIELGGKNMAGNRYGKEERGTRADSTASRSEGGTENQEGGTMGEGIRPSRIGEVE